MFEATARLTIRDGEVEGSGEPSPPSAKAMEAMGATFTQLSFFQGLPVLDELPA